MKVAEARQFALASHAAARNATEPEAVAAARSAGHAAATAHVPGHARHAAAYALKSAVDPENEIAWQKRERIASLRRFR